MNTLYGPPKRIPSVENPSVTPHGGGRALQMARKLAKTISHRGASQIRKVAHILKPFLTAGYRLPDLIRAIEYGPDGQKRKYTTNVYHLPGWLRYRLAHLLLPDGTAKEPASKIAQERQAITQRIKKDQEAYQRHQHHVEHQKRTADFGPTITRRQAAYLRGLGIQNASELKTCPDHNQPVLPITTNPLNRNLSGCQPCNNRHQSEKHWNQPKTTCANCVTQPTSKPEY